MAGSRSDLLARLLTLVTLASVQYKSLGLVTKTQLPHRLQPYLHLINNTQFERAHSESVLREEWNLWKRTHDKQYLTGRRDIERFAVWKSNKVYIDYHNEFENIFGYKLAMNQFGDLVSFLCIPMCIWLHILSLVYEHTTYNTCTCA